MDDKQPLHTFLTKGKLERSTERGDPDYHFPSSKDFFSVPANLIPAISSVSGGRVLLGSKATLQAVSLVRPEAPLVQTVAGKGEASMHEKLGIHLLTVTSPVAGKVTELSPDHIEVTSEDGKKHPFELYDNYNLGRKTFMHHTAKVAVGASVKKGQILALSNYTDDKGVLALGTNLTTAVMPYRSGNFEDAWVVTESGAKKLEAEQLIRFRVEKKMGLETSKARYVSLFPNKFTNTQLATIDADGVVKPGVTVKTGDPVILALTPKELKSTDLALGRLSKLLANAFKDNAETWEYDHTGTVTDVSKAGSLISVNLKTRRSLQVGDKLCVTPDHEVLTKEGWKLIPDVTVDDEVYTLGPSGQIELLRPCDVPSFWYEGPMYSLETSQVSMCVTPNHRLYAQRRFNNRYTGSYNLTPATELAGKRFKLKSNGTWKGKSPTHVRVGDLDVPVLTYMTVLGLYLGDGNSFWHAPSGTYGFDIAQKKQPETQKIKELLASCGFAAYRSKTGFRVHSKAWARHLKPLGHAHQKHVPRFVFDFGIPELQRLFDCLMLTDGSTKGTGHSYCSVSAQLINDVHQLVFLLGGAGRLSHDSSHPIMKWKTGKYSVGRTSYRLGVYRDKLEPEVNHGHTKVQSGQVESWVDYVGDVFCLSFNRNHVFYVRHCGKAHWTGNSNAFGAKGVVGSLIANSLAPTDKDGKPVDILLNSMSITSRVAPALAISLAMGKVAQKQGKPVHMTHFVEGSSIQHTVDLLKKEGVKDVEELYDPVTGRHVSVLTGPLYFTRLIHIAEDKESSRSQGVAYNWDGQPAKSPSESAKRIGSLSTAALLSHGATAVLRDMGTVKATKNDEYWRRLKLGLTVPNPPVPFVFDKFVASMHGAGIKVTKKDDVFSILPMTDKDTHTMSTGEIKNAGTFKVKNEKALAEAGGLFDPAVVGLLGDRYNHIDLSFAVPNPISEDYLRKLLGVTKVEYEGLVVSGALRKRLDSINLDAKLDEYLKYLKSGKKTERADALKLVAFLRALQAEKLHPRDLMLSKLPVIPAQYRPMMIQGDMVLSSPVNTLYRELIHNNNALKSTVNVPEPVVDRLKKDQYAAVKAIYGLGDPITVKSREKNIRGLLATTIGSHGGSGKHSMFQARVVNKSLDLVGRAVLAPDAKLDLDEASVPQDILWKTYSPFIIRRLVTRGVPAVKALDYVKLRNPLAMQALQEELKSRPGIISRDPSLHKFNLTGFFLKLNPDPKDRTIKLNPLVFKGFNADNDGDQLNVNIPVSESARLEVIEKMLPSANLLSPKTYQPMYVPGNEAALGLFQASTEDHHQPPKKFATEAAALEAFHKGHLDVGDRVAIG